jgi:predicted transcriptional regulator
MWCASNAGIADVTPHGLEHAAYLARRNLADHPITAPSYSAHRSAVAKQLGLGERPRAIVRISDHEFDPNADTGSS